jgi:uncharacterized membrane protein HdeD (DUF308 family)
MTDILTSGTPSATGERSILTKLYLVRGVLAVVWAVVWAVVFAGSHGSLDAVAITLLVVYPLIDAVSSWVDHQVLPAGSERRITAFNGVLSTLAAIGLGVAGGVDETAVLAVFGAWAIISGAAQLVVGLRRRGPELGKQWPVLIAGGLSVVVGIFYDLQAAGDNPSLEVLSVYATGGGVFFIIQAGLLALRARSPRHRTVG